MHSVPYPCTKVRLSLPFFRTDHDNDVLMGTVSDPALLVLLVTPIVGRYRQIVGRYHLALVSSRLLSHKSIKT